MYTQVNALIMDESDNIAVCIEMVRQGDSVRFRRSDRVEELVAGEDIPVWHKVAISEIEEGKQVIKYGETIGVSTCRIPAGGWVSHLNLVGVPRDYDDEIAK